MTYGLHLVLNIQAPQAYSKIQSTHKSVQLLLSTFAPARHPFGLLPLPNLAREAFFGATLALLAIASSYLPPPDANISIVTSSYLGTIGPVQGREHQ